MCSSRASWCGGATSCADCSETEKTVQILVEFVDKVGNPVVTQRPVPSVRKSLLDSLAPRRGVQDPYVHVAEKTRFSAGGAEYRRASLDPEAPRYPDFEERATRSGSPVDLS